MMTWPELGIDSFHVIVESNYTLHIEPQDMAKFYYELHNNHLMSQENTNYLLNLLIPSEEPTDFDEYMPEGYTYLNKYGNLHDAYHDTGILTTPTGQTYYIAIYTDGWENNNGAYNIPEFYEKMAQLISSSLK